MKASVLLRKLDEAAHEDGAILAHFHLMDALPLIADVVEAAEEFEEAYQRSLGSASAYDVTVRDGAQFKLRAALTALRDALQPEGDRT